MHSQDNEEGTVEEQSQAESSMLGMVGKTVSPSETESGEAARMRSESSADRKMVPLAALHEERGRRQALQKEREHLRNRLDFLKEVVKSQTSLDPDNEDDRESSTLDATKAKKFFQDVYQSSLFPQILALREDIVRLRHSDYDEVIGRFAPELSSDPSLQKVVMEADDPAETAYQIAKQSIELSADEERRENKTVQRIERNINAPRTPVSSGIGISPGGISVEKLLEMPQEEFSRIWDTMNSTQRRKLCQG